MVIKSTIRVKGDNKKGGHPGNSVAKGKKGKQDSSHNSRLNTKQEG